MKLLEFYIGLDFILGGYIIIPLHSLMPTKSQQQVFPSISYLTDFRCKIRCILLYKSESSFSCTDFAQCKFTLFDSLILKISLLPRQERSLNI